MTSIEQKVDRTCGEVKALKKRLEFTIDLTKVEFWTDIGVAPEYSISSFGRVRRRRDDFYPKITFNGSINYYRVRLGDKVYLLHRLLAQAFIPNPEGKPCLDHIDGDTKNNSLGNLRWATHSENMRNRKKYRNNTSDYTGVSFNKTAGKWEAYVKIYGKKKYLGLYHTAEEASAVYAKAAQELHGEFFCHR